MPVVAVWTPEDGLLGALAPIGLALSAGSALVIDLDPLGPSYPGRQSLASLASEGLRKDDLATRRGVAVLRNGGVSIEEAAPVVEALTAVHDTVVLRLAPRVSTPGWECPVIPVRLMLPGGWRPPFAGFAVYQATPAWEVMPAAGIRLPVPRRSTVRGLLEGRRPPARDRWVAAWRSVWRVPWPR